MDIYEKIEKYSEYHLPVCAHSGKAGRWLARIPKLRNSGPKDHQALV